MILETNSTWAKGSIHRFLYWREKATVRLLNHRWLLLLLLGASALIFELLENLNTHRPIDMHFMRELLFFGAVYPLVTIWLLNKLVSTQAEKNNIVWQQERSRQLKQALAQAQDLETLHQIIVSFPETIAPTVGVTLYRPIPNNHRLELVAEWWLREGERPLTLSHTITPGSCGGAAHTLEHGLHLIVSDDGEDIAPYGCCLPLLRGAELVGVLQFYLPYSIKLTADQIAVFNQTAVAIALALSAATPQNMELIRAGAARSERERIARHLHDTLGQKLAYLQMTLTRLTADDLDVDMAAIQQGLDQVRQVSNEAYEQVRQILLIMQAEETGNLTDALVTQAQVVAQAAEFDLRYTLEGQPQSLPPLVKRKILFIFREALHNIQRHAQATAVNLEILWDEDTLTVILRDNGSGFNIHNDWGQGHFGLLIMAQRAEEINADLSVTSAEGQGTQVRLNYSLSLID